MVGFLHQCENKLESSSISKDDQLNWNCNKLSVHNENNLKLNCVIKLSASGNKLISIFNDPISLT